jgi:uncharacterized membrane protein
VKIRLCWVLLAISLAGNLFFIGGYLYSNQMAGNLQRSPQARMEQLTKRLQLDETAKQALLQARDDLVQGSAQFNSSRTELMQGFWGQLNDRDIDRRQLQAQLQQLSELELAHRLQLMQRVDSFLQQLNPEQRQRLLKMLDRRNLFSYLDNHAQRKAKTNP